MVSVQQARDWLRIDGTDNDEIITGLLAAAVDYIEVATGATEDEQASVNCVSLCDTITKMLLTIWYKPEQAEAEKVQRTVDSLLKLLTVKIAEARKNG